MEAAHTYVLCRAPHYTVSGVETVQLKKGRHSILPFFLQLRSGKDGLKLQLWLLSGAVKGCDSEFPVDITASAQTSGSEWQHSTGGLRVVAGCGQGALGGTQSQAEPRGEGVGPEAPLSPPHPTPSPKDLASCVGASFVGSPE